MVLRNSNVLNVIIGYLLKIIQKIQQHQLKEELIAKFVKKKYNKNRKKRLYNSGLACGWTGANDNEALNMILKAYNIEQKRA